jgi:serine/threonine-protein kinase 11
MITPDGTLKLSDFGESTEISKFSETDEISDSNGTPTFQCPQIARGDDKFSGFKSDIWAAGVTLFHLVTGDYPFKGETHYKLYENIKNNDLVIPEYVDKELAYLLGGMLEKEEEKRFSIDQIKETKWFKTKLIDEKKEESFHLIDRWRSFSLSPYIEQYISQSNEQTQLDMKLNTIKNEKYNEEEEEKKHENCLVM